MNDAPPVTKTLFPVQNVSADFTRFHPPQFYLSPRAGAADNLNEFFELFDSIIAGRGSERRLAHALHAFGIARKLADHCDELIQSIHRANHITTVRRSHNALYIAPFRS